MSERPPRPRDPRPESAAPSAAPAPAKPSTPLKLGRPKRRLRVGLLALAFVFSLYGGRLVQLQVADAGGYAAKAAADRTADVTLFATRGAILDSAGQPLAESVDAVDVIADPLVIAQQKQDPAVYASKLAAYLGNPAGSVNVAALRAKLADSTSQYAVLARQVTPAVWKQIKALDLDGITGNEDPKVVYPQGTIAPNAVGFVNSEGAGGAGLEEEYDKMLAGTNGKISYQAAYGYEIPTTGINEQAAVDGTSVETTIDSKIQWAAQQAIDAEVAQTKAALGTVVVMDPRSGAVLAIASSPTYDPNNRERRDHRRARRRGRLRRVRARIRRQGRHHVRGDPAGRDQPGHQGRRPADAQHRRRLRRARRHRPRHRAPDAQRDPRRVQQHRHRPDLAAARAEQHARAQRHTVRLLLRLRPRPTLRTRPARRIARHPRAGRRLEPLAAVHRRLRPGPRGQRRPGHQRVRDDRERGRAGRPRTWSRAT